MTPLGLPESSGGPLPSSFRDPSGFLFRRGGTLYRQVNRSHKQHYDLLISSGLYKTLVERELLIPHEEVSFDSPSIKTHKTLKPEVVSFISYPYEWSFSQLQDAALVTMQIQKLALQFGMSLKDASAYNIQFHKGTPLLVDTLSLEQYVEDLPWVAYRQFCQHFLAPLALMSRVDGRLNQVARNHIDGVPLDFAGRLLPWRTCFSLPLFLHIHLHARAQRRYSSKEMPARNRRLSRNSFLGLIDSLEAAVKRLSWNDNDKSADWSDYYSRSSYDSVSFQDKIRIVSEWLDKLHPVPRCLWDFAANTGLFSRLASRRGIFTVSIDSDLACVEMNYRQSRRQRETQVLPLCMDLTNPSPSLGWQNRERMSLLDRGPADVALALAIIHHLAISNNLPLSRIADFFAQCCGRLVIEFVPKEDPQVQRLLASRKDIFVEYSQTAFENEFSRVFALRERAPIAGSLRTLYLMEKVT